MPQVTVVPADHLIIVDGAALVFPFDAPTNLHALQWRGGTGHTEWTDGPNKPLTAEDYDEQVVPYVKLWQAEKARLEKKAAEEAAARALPDAKSAKQNEIQNGYDAALAASLTMPAASPTAQDVSIGAALLAVDDAEGLAYVQALHAARRDELLAAVEAAETVEAVEAVVVDYDVEPGGTDHHRSGHGRAWPGYEQRAGLAGGGLPHRPVGLPAGAAG